jgi:hypothetical protein
MKQHHLYNHGPHRDAYRGLFVLDADDSYRWASSGLPVAREHGDFLSDADPAVLLRQGRVSS